MEFKLKLVMHRQKHGLQKTTCFKRFRYRMGMECMIGKFLHSQEEG